MRLTVPTTATDFDQIHALNYRTFVEEIPQHQQNSTGRLVDKFHSQNNYIIAKQEENVVAMISYSLVRPFSLDYKLANLDSHLPRFNKITEVRLLAVDKNERKTMLTYMLLKKAAQELTRLNVDIAIISGTTRELNLYKKIGFISFAHLVGTHEASYQPMYITLNHLRDDFKGD